jgi:hypothetical protein
MLTRLAQGRAIPLPPWPSFKATATCTLPVAGADRYLRPAPAGASRPWLT